LGRDSVFGFLARLALSVVFMIVALRAVDFAALAASLFRLDTAWLLAAFVAFACQIPFAAWRWRQIAVASAPAPDYRTMLRWCAMAQFFNQTLPTTIGGDAVRTWLMVRAGGRKLGEAISVIVTDRIAGVSAVLLIVAAAIPFQADAIADPLARSALNAATLGGLVALIVAMTLVRLRRTMFDRIDLLRPLQQLIAPVAALMTRPAVALRVLMASLVIHALTITAISALARGFQLPVAPWLLAILVPPVLLVSMVPLSIAGWGLREMAMVTALGFVGVAPDAAVSVSLMMGIVLLVVGVPGGILWVLERPSRKAADSAALGLGR